jgi:hypothetical protein
MTDQVMIYMIVMLNTFCQLMLIWRQKFPVGQRNRYCAAAVAIPVVLILSMRLLIASGLIHGHLADQSFIEHLTTKAASFLLIAGPWFVTTTAIVSKRRKRILSKMRAAA